jgi:hypothetical protein
MSNDKMREEFENSPRFKGMDFTRAPGHPDYYESPYANGSWDGWKASRESLVIELPSIKCIDLHEYSPRATLAYCEKAVKAAGLKVRP